MDKDVRCKKCGVEFNNRNHKKKHMRNPCGDKVDQNSNQAEVPGRYFQYNSSPEVGLCREDLEVEGREGRVTYSLTLMCAASPCLQRIVSGSGTSSPLHPLGLTTVIVPDFSIWAVTSLINLLKNGTTTTSGPQVAEVIELARVLELKELEQEEVVHQQEDHGEYLLGDDDQVAADFELDVLALAERAEEEEQQAEKKMREEEELRDVVVEEEDEKRREEEEEELRDAVVDGEDMTNYPLVPFPLVSFTCSSCSKDFPAMNKLNHHYVEMHKDPMSCTICYKTFSSKKLFIRHSSVHLPPTFTCETCGKTFKRADNLQRHQVSCHPTAVPCSPAQCTNCGKQFSRTSSLVKHMLVVHGANRPPNALRDKYLARVRARKRVSCATCSITFKTKSNFKVHMKKKHSGTLLLAPGPAGGEGGFAGEFMMVLDGSSMCDEDTLPCKFCNLRFDSHKDLVEHKNKKHQGERVHPCSTCDMAFKSLPALYKHKSRQHSGKVFVCEGCGKTFKTSDSLNRHKKFVCGKPRHRKNFNNLSKWGKGHRVKTTAEEMIVRMDGMGEEERKKTVLAIAKKRPDILDHLTKNPFTMSDICQIICDANLSDSQCLIFLSGLRKHWKGIPSYVTRALRDKKRKLDGFYTSVKLDETTLLHFKDGEDNILTRWVTYCHDLPGLLNGMELLEGEKKEDFYESVGYDDGRGILKCSLNRTKKGKTAMKVKRGREQPINEDRGSKHAQIIFAVASVKESQHNTDVFYQLLGLADLPNIQFSLDLKAAIFFTGIQTARARYPCLYAHCLKSGRDRTASWITGEDRTIENLLENQLRWRDETGGDRAQLKEYFNSEYPPLLTPTPGATGPTTVLSRIPIPLLHTLLLNPANHILAHLTSVWPPLDNFFGELHVTREDYHGGSFEGNELKKILKNLERLEELLPAVHQPYIVTLKELRNLNTMANLVNLPPNYSAVIASWRAAWEQLRLHTANDISTINSIHIVNSHLEQWYDLHGDSLVKVSDHTVESCHQSLERTLRRGNYWVKDVTCDSHGTKLFRGVMVHNCYVMDAMGISVQGPDLI